MSRPRSSRSALALLLGLLLTAVPAHAEGGPGGTGGGNGDHASASDALGQEGDGTGDGARTTSRTTPRAAPAAPTGFAYLPYVTPAYARALLGQSNLREWQKNSTNISSGFAAVRRGIMSNLSARLFRQGAIRRNWSLAKLPLPVQNRITLNVLAKKANFLPTLAEQVAFMAKVLHGEGQIMWITNDGDTDLSEVTQWPHKATPKYKLNCSGYITYAAYMAGLPKDTTDHVTMAQRVAAQRDATLLDSYMLGDWRGYWKPVFNATTGQTTNYKNAGYGVGDCIILYHNQTLRTSWTAPRQTDAYAFYHIEIITKPAAGHNDTQSLGNLGEGPRYSELFSRLTRLGQWISSDNMFTHLNATATHSYKNVIYKFQERSIPDTIQLPDEAFPEE